MTRHIANAKKVNAIHSVKGLAIITAVVLCMFIAAACGSNELVGKWQMVGLSESHMEFKSNGNYKIVMYSSELTNGMEEMYEQLGVELPDTSEQKGEYTLKDNTITLVDNENSEQIVNMVLDGDRILSEGEVVLIREGALD